MKEKMLLIGAALVVVLSISVVANYYYSNYKSSKSDSKYTNPSYGGSTESDRYSYITGEENSGILGKLEYSFGYGYNNANIQSSYDFGYQETGYRNPGNMQNTYDSQTNRDGNRYNQGYGEGFDIADRMEYSFGFGYDMPMYTSMGTEYSRGGANYINPVSSYNPNKPRNYHYSTENREYNSRYSYNMYERREGDYYRMGYKQRDSSMPTYSYGGY